MRELDTENNVRLKRAINLLTQAARELYTLGSEDFVTTGEQIDAMIIGLQRRHCCCTPIAVEGGGVFHHINCTFAGEQASKVGQP